MVDQQDAVHAVFMAKAPELGLYYTRTENGGQSWSAPTRISTSVRYKLDYHFITVDGKGRLHVFWHDGNPKDDSKPAEVMYTRSPDGGTTWEAPRMLSNDDGAHSAFPRADFGFTNSDTLLLAWRDARPAGDDWDIYGAISYDGGATWNEQLLAGGSGKQWDPMVQIDHQGTIHLGVMEYPAGHLIDVFVWYTRSTDGGANWSEPLTMREARTIFPVFSYDFINDVLWYYLRIESAPGPNATSDLGVRYSTDGGQTWSDMERLTALEKGGTKFPAFGMGRDGIPRLVYSLKDSDGNDKLYFQKRKSAPVANPADDQPETFFAVHCEPQTPHLFPQLIKLVEKANEYGIPLTIELTPQWVETIMADSNKVQRLRTWQTQGHEIAAQHHSLYHPYWDGFTNYPTSVIQSLGKMNDYRGDMNAFRRVVEQAAGDSLMLNVWRPGGDGSGFLGGLAAGLSLSHWRRQTAATGLLLAARGRNGLVFRLPDRLLLPGKSEFGQRPQSAVRTDA
ncbi:MAG: sialidase family protein [candidate division KSB1 bacterium]|nr:sialidase family protein [candidate division KSB1 bacterium]